MASTDLTIDVLTAAVAAAMESGDYVIGINTAKDGSQEIVRYPLSALPSGGQPGQAGASVASFTITQGAVVPGQNSPATLVQTLSNGQKLPGVTFTIPCGADGEGRNDSDYTLPEATDEVLGGVTVGAGLNVTKGKLSVADTPVSAMTTNGATVLPIPTSGDIIYLITPASATTLSFSGSASANSGQFITLMIIGAGFSVALPPEGSTVGYPDGTAPTVSTTAGDITAVRFLAAAGAHKIIGGF